MPPYGQRSWTVLASADGLGAPVLRRLPWSPSRKEPPGWGSFLHRPNACFIAARVMSLRERTGDDGDFVTSSPHRDALFASRLSIKSWRCNTSSNTSPSPKSLAWSSPPLARGCFSCCDGHFSAVRLIGSRSRIRTRQRSRGKPKRIGDVEECAAGGTGGKFSN
jgi:hypothetical protein